jgi:hypothetical protein
MTLLRIRERLTGRRTNLKGRDGSANQYKRNRALYHALHMNAMSIHISLWVIELLRSAYIDQLSAEELGRDMLLVNPCSASASH